MTRAVLGIDAAWTPTQPSGVALAVERADGWCLAAVTPSYAHFHALADGEALPTRPGGGQPDATALLADATRLAGVAPVLVAIDMPLSLDPIIGRRVADNAVSRHYGGRKCGTHSPSAERPGAIADRLTQGFAAAGYPLLTEAIDRPGIIEVYPHPALVELMPAAERVPYKAAKTLTYWPGLDHAARVARLEATWAAIVDRLEHEVTGVRAALVSAASLPRKAREDMLDAVICCLVGIRAVQGRARPFGEERAAIWVPVN